MWTLREAAAAVETMLASLRGGHVLITSRLTQWSGSVEPLELDVLDPADAAQFLLERTGRSRRKLASDEADAAELARELDGLALAVEQAAAYIAHRRISLADYLRDWRARRPAVQEWHNPRLMKYPRSVAVTWETTLSQLNTGEIALLRLFALLAPDPIPLFVFEGETAQRLWQEAIALLQQEVSASVGAAGRFSTLSPRWRTTAWSSGTRKSKRPPSTAWCRRSSATAYRKPGRETWLTLGLRLLDAGATRRCRRMSAPGPAGIRLLPHVAAAAAQADQAGIPEPTASLMNALGLLLLRRHSTRRPSRLMRRALAIDEQSFGPDHPNVASDLNNLAHVAPGHEPAGGGRALDAPRPGHRRAKPTGPITPTSPATSTTWRSCSRPRTGWRRPSR